jgi:hypothetical protein
VNDLGRKMLDAFVIGALLAILVGVTLKRLAHPLAPSHCGCPAPGGSCQVPCSACCNDPATPEHERCPCVENPTSCR